MLKFGNVEVIFTGTKNLMSEANDVHSGYTVVETIQSQCTSEFVREQIESHVAVIFKAENGMTTSIYSKEPVPGFEVIEAKKHMQFLADRLWFACRPKPAPVRVSTRTSSERERSYRERYANRAR